jgi:hypothetical protein
MILAESLGIQAGEMVSFIGAGGKTTMLFTLQRCAQPVQVVQAVPIVQAVRAIWVRCTT